ncbi:CvpA family protein [Novispirillum sp. DQ9]|uniref:CvpA family protein n=1 Tax=Novispirillum sp. DQ9 TaxID=3398612 RepID=UPI003C7E23B7
MDSMPVNAFDLVVIVVLLVSAVVAFFRGFVHEVLAIAAWAGAALAALHGLPYLQPIAREHIPLTWAADAVAAAAIFLVVLLILAIITRAVSKRVQSSTLGALDRSLGFLFGLARGAFVVAIGFVVLSWVWPEADDRPAWIQQARSLPLVEQGAAMVSALIPESLDAEAERTRTAAREAEEQARQALELKKTYDRLTQPATTPQPPPAAAPTAPAPPAGAPTQRESGYDTAPRQDMNRLIESQINR